MPEQRLPSHFEPRLASLETSVKSLHGDIQNIALAVNDLRTAVSNQRVPNWNVILGGLAVGVTIIMSIGASYISPLNIALNYQEKINEQRSVLLNDLQERLRVTEIALEAQKVSK